MSDRPLCVLSIAHPAIKRDSGRLRYDPLAARIDLDLHLLVPNRWHQFGRVLTAETAADSDIQLEIAPISLAKAGPLSWYLHFYPGLRRLVRRLDPDVIHLWEEPWSVVALQACLLKGRAALVLEVDQNIVKRLPPPFEALRRFVLRRTAHVLCRSPDAAAVVRANGYTGPVSFIGYGVDQNLFHAADTAAAAQAAGPLRIGYVGRLVVEKGLDDALDAMALSSADVRLAIKSEGPHEACLRSRVAQLGLQGKVTFEPWGARTASPSRRLRRSSPTLGSLPQAKGIGYPDGCPRAGSLAEGEVGSTPHSPGREARIRSIGCHQDQDEVSWPQVA